MLDKQAQPRARGSLNSGSSNGAPPAKGRRVGHISVSNRHIIRKITIRVLRSDKRRNFFVVAAIALTAFMIASVLSVGVSYYKTVSIAPFRSEGVYAHAFLENQNPENVAVISSLDYVRRVDAAYRVGIGYPEGFDDGVTVVALGEEGWRRFQAPVFTDILGNRAIAENEIMLSRAHLARMGITEPQPGMEIRMEFSIPDHATGELGERRAETFILSAIFTEYVSLNPGNAYTPVFVSEAFAERYGQSGSVNAVVRVVFKNQNRAAEYVRLLAQDLGLVYDSEVALHPALSITVNNGLPTMYIAVSVIVLFFMFVGFLLIYNVMYISVSRDVRFYGLLKTVGTTPRQLRRIVNGQVLLMYTLGLPAGLASAALTSFVTVPSMISSRTGAVVSFSPLIYIGGAVFTLITAYIGASISARKAASVSPVEAVRYAGEQPARIKPRASANGKPSRMAWRNMFRERKRAFVVLLSLFLGITVFTTVMAIVNSTDIDGNIAYWYDHDITISAVNTESDDFGIVGMDRGLIDEIAAIPGVSEVREQTLGIAAFDYSREAAAAVQSSVGFFQPLLEISGIDRAHLEELISKAETPVEHGLSPLQDRGASAGEMLPDFSSWSGAESNQVFIEAFERGEIVLVDDGYGSLVMGDMFCEYFPVGSELYFELGEHARIPVNARIAGYHTIHNMTGNSISFISGGLSLIMSNTFLNSIGAGGGVNHLGVMVEEGMDEPVNAAVSAIAREHGLPVASVADARRAGEESRLAMFVLGAVLSGILALIGLFNFINLISVGLLTRKREFAALESVGMSKRQMRRMLRWEGALYWIVVIAASVTAGTGITYGLFCLISNQTPSQFPRFIYPLTPVAVVFCVMVLICTITPEICYRGISKATLVERLREAE